METTKQEKHNRQKHKNEKEHNKTNKEYKSIRSKTIRKTNTNTCEAKQKQRRGNTHISYCKNIKRKRKIKTNKIKNHQKPKTISKANRKI